MDAHFGTHIYTSRLYRVAAPALAEHEELVDPFSPIITVGKEEGWKESCGVDCPGLVNPLPALMKPTKPLSPPKNSDLHYLACSELHC